MRAVALLALLVLVAAGCLGGPEARASPRVGDLDAPGRLVNVTVYNDARADVVVRLTFDDEEVFQRAFPEGGSHGALYEDAALFRWDAARATVRAERVGTDHAASRVVDVTDPTHVAVIVFDSRVEVQAAREPFAWM